ncbi:DUF6583 family protein [Staphylococcus equorum]|uniref:DUF6583 family protein n=1 Tax=Staphylococcus equorum TaxID=246432 RepID=UPI00203B8522|nr:DUF6583 family protein [Staphylococcus equorum]MCM3072911.1 hypothetical protein [Staphylococcus equorum]MEB7846876.1 hypothetical protein [Staphylococcus equorum]MEB8107807.1 hypothetical protein [Staphylococcus equorum]MEB8174112.1 hypothetical protein [Staphylococcus equorum]
MSKTVKIVIAVVIGLLLVVGIGGAAAYYFMKNSPKNTYLLSEQETAKQMQEYAKDRFENEFKFQDKMKDESYLISLDASADVPEKLLKSSDIPKSAIDASKIGFKMGHDPENEKSVLALNPTVADNEIGEFQWAADEDNQYYSAPILDDVYKAKNDELVDVYEKLTGETVSSSSSSSSSDFSSSSSSMNSNNSAITNDTLNLNSLLSGTQISQEKVEEISERYSELIIDKLDDDNFEKEDDKIDVDGEEKDTNKVTMDISKAETKSILTAVLEKAKEDKDIKGIAEDQFNAEEYDDSIDEALEEVKDADKDEFPSIKSVIWEDDNQILKRDLTLKDNSGAEIKLEGTSLIDDDKLVMDYNVSADEAKISLKGESTKEDDKYDDKYTLGFDDGIKESDIKVTNKETVDGNKRTDKGDIEISANYDETTIEYENKLETDVKNNSQKQDLDITTEVQYEPVTVNIKGETKLKEDIKFDKAGAKDLNTMSNSDFSKLQKEISDNAEDILKDVVKDLEDK